MNNKIKFAFVMLSALSSSFAEISDEAALYEMAKGLSYKQETRAEALEAYQKLVALAPSNPVYLKELAQIQFYAKQNAEALATISKLSEEQLTAESRLLKAQLLAVLNKHEEAYAQYTRLVQEGGKAESLLGLARSASKTKREVEAVKAYQQYVSQYAVLAKPTEYAEVGNVLRGTGDNKEAEAVLRKGLAQYPKSQEIKKVLGELLAWDSDSAKQKEALTLLSGVGAASAETKKARIYSAVKAKAYESAIDDLKTYADKDRNELILAALGAYLDEVNQETFDGVLEKLCRENDSVLKASLLARRGREYQALAVATGNTPLRAGILRSGERFAEANAIERTAVSQKAKEAVSALPRGYAALEAKEYANAIAAFEEYLATAPTSVSAQYGLASALMGNQQIGQAKKAALKTLELENLHKGAALLVARASAYKGNYQKAQKYLDQLDSDASQKDPVVTLERARLALWRGENAQYQELRDRLNVGNTMSEDLLALDAEQALVTGKIKTAQALSAEGKVTGVQAQACCALNKPAQAVSLLTQTTTRNDFEESVLAAAQRKTAPHISFASSYWVEDGRDKTSDVRRWIAPEVKVNGFASESVELSLSAANIVERFDIGENLNSLQVQAGTRAQIADGFELAGALGFRETSEDDIDSPVFGNVGFNYRFDAPLTLGISYAKTNEFGNFFAIQDKIQADRYRVELGGALPDVVYGVSVDLLDYSDDNSGVLGVLKGGQRIYDGSTEVWVDGIAEYRDTDELTVIGEDNGTQTLTIHPYWTPEAFWAGFVGLRVKKNLGLQSYCALPQYVEASVRAKTDTDHNPGVELAATYSKLISADFEVQAQGLWHSSEQWDAAFAGLSISYLLR